MLSFLLLWACSSIDAEEELTPTPISTSYVSSDLWLDHARSLIAEISNTDNQKVFFAEMPDNQSVLEISLDEKNRLTRVLQNDLLNREKEFYFEKGRLAFSKIKLSDGYSILSAYADQIPYAHCYSDGGEPDQNLVRTLGLKNYEISAITRLAKEYALKEINHSYNIRIEGDQAKIVEKLNEENEFKVIMNVRKDERLKIQLASKARHVYFMLSPNNGSDMEHKFWRGPSPITGDITIRVFAAEEVSDKAFELLVASY